MRDVWVAFIRKKKKIRMLLGLGKAEILLGFRKVECRCMGFFYQRKKKLECFYDQEKLEYFQDLEKLECFYELEKMEFFYDLEKSWNTFMIYKIYSILINSIF